MKVSATNKGMEFKPIKLEITLDTLEEVEKLYSIFNYSSICDYASGVIDFNEIRQEMQNVSNGNISGNTSDLHEFMIRDS